LNSTKRVGPVIDPTIGRLQPWEHWHQDVVPKRAIRTREYVFSQSNLNMFNFDQHFMFFCFQS